MRSRAGLTILESLAAVVLVAMLLGVSLEMLSAVTAQGRVARQRELAVQEAANAMERVFARPWDALTKDRLKSVSLSSDARRLLPGAELTIDVVPSSEEPEAKQIAVCVRWRAGSGPVEKAVRLTAWRYRQ